MSQFYIVNENTEDTLGSANELRDAVRLAREAAQQGQAGDLVSILESGGKAVRQFVRLTDGTVAEQPVARGVNPTAGEATCNGAEQITTADRPHG